MEMNNNFYKMTNIADKVSSQIIKAHMRNTKYKLENFPNASVALFDANKTLMQGEIRDKVNFNKDFYMQNNSFTLVSRLASGHLGVEYVVVQSNHCNQNVAALKNRVAYTVILTAIFIIIISVFLSYIFLRPIKEKMQEVEEFVKDTTHELNTPITALMMSTSRLRAKQVYDDKIAKNINISTKQLHDIYSALSFLSFDNKSEESIELDFAKVIQEDISYMSELLERKNIGVVQDLQQCMLNITPTKAKMIINNLLGNSIKYSTPNTTITIKTTSNSFTIEDEGIGIAKDKLDEIFKRFVRANSYAGGFGVGLSIVESIIREYNYQITIESELEVGTTVKILFD